MKRRYLLMTAAFLALSVTACGSKAAEQEAGFYSEAADAKEASGGAEQDGAENKEGEEDHEDAEDKDGAGVRAEDGDDLPDAAGDESGTADSFADAVNMLGYDILERLEEGNVCISPYSIETALGMIANGAQKETLSETLSAMHVGDLDVFNRQVDASGKKLESDAMDIRVANSAWYRDENLNDSMYDFYLPLLADSYQAEGFPVEFTDPGVVSEMNEWIAKATNDKITDMVQELEDPERIALILFNAVYFDAEWERPFGKEGTFDETFYGKDKEEEAPFMHMRDSFFAYYEQDGIAALRMRYKDSDMAMDLFLPIDKEQDITALFNALSYDQKKALWQGLSDAEEVLITSVKIPRFTFSSETLSLTEMMRELGMKRIFDSDAQLGIISDNAVLDEIFHKTCIRVDENGTEAAAVTELAVREMALLLDENPVTFEADVPFVYTVNDTADGTILFLGRMESIP